ncbi:MAG: ATP-binding protein [Deltaproteobacteria bacterium]|nr:ATP-binding protein [Deltaproteobacteria bacterium]
MTRIREKWTNLHRGLGFRIALSVGIILLASYVVFLYLLLDVQQGFYLDQIVREAARFSSAVLNSTYSNMLHDDPEATKSFLQDIGRQKGVSDVRIYSHDGLIKFSNHPEEVGRKVNIESEACVSCHSTDKPFSEVITDKRTRIHHGDHDRILGMITPIYNETSCYTSACHIHPKDRKVLGVLDMKMSLRRFDSHVRSLVIKVILLGIGTFSAVLGTIGLYIVFRVHRPVSRLQLAMQKVAAGDFNYKTPVESKDQLGQLAHAFNLMRAQIKRRTQELLRSRLEYKNLFEQVPCFISVIDKDFRIIRQNSHMTGLFKGSVGMHCYEVFKKKHERCEDCHAIKTFSEGQKFIKEHCGLDVSGKDANYVSYSSPIFNEKGEVVYSMLIAVDIRDRVKLAHELQVSKDFQTNLIENSIHGIIATDKDGRVTIFNQAAEKLLDYEPSEVIGDREIQRYFPKQFVAMILDSRLGKPLQDNRLVELETVIHSRDGEPIPIKFSGLILFEFGAPIGSVGFLEDLRTFKRLEREKQASDRLAVVGQTVAGLAHGIKNIIQGLEGGVYVVETAIEDKDSKLMDRGWNMVKNNIHRIGDLVKDLLAYSKERAPEYEATDPNALAEEVCTLFEIKAQEKSIVIERQFDPNLGKMFQVFLDQRGIHTCLSNLISNAIDACEIDKNKASHKIVMRTIEDTEGGVIFEVSDDGSGMSDETRRKVFSSFYSTKGSRGTGLGLLVTSKIVAEHGGQIYFESVQGVGTTFTIRLPLGQSSGATTTVQKGDDDSAASES